MVALLPYLDSTITVLSLSGYQYNDLQDVESCFESQFPNYKLYSADDKLIKEGFDHVRKYDIV